MDVFLLMPSILLDEDTERKKLYGTAGRYRPKPYGLEYRSLSNYWLKEQRRINWVFGNIQEVILFVNNGFNVAKGDYKYIRSAARCNDKEFAEQIIDAYEVPMPNYFLELA